MADDDLGLFEEFRPSRAVELARSVVEIHPWPHLEIRTQVPTFEEPLGALHLGQVRAEVASSREFPLGRRNLRSIANLEEFAQRRALLDQSTYQTRFGR